MRLLIRTATVVAAVAVVAVIATTVGLGANAAARPSHQVRARQAPAADVGTQSVTPIRHLVVVFDENISFDHYFGTYPHAANTDGTPFHAQADTPAVNGLTPALLHHNPNEDNPQRLTPAQSVTCDQNHEYTPEQEAFDGGLMDEFVQHTEQSCTDHRAFYEPGLVMDYYDGNTVSALWNYAQRFALSDNNYGSQFGPSSIGAFNLAAGRTAQVYAVDPITRARVPLPSKIGSPNAQGLGTLYSDEDPAFDDCSSTSAPQIVATGNNIGELLSRARVSWGWFQGGFAPTSRTEDGKAVCASQHANAAGIVTFDYTPHWDPFQYYAATANPHHLAPRSLAEVGHAGRANHNYDLSYFYRVLRHGTLPAVSFVKPPSYQSGHAYESGPLDEQHFLVKVLNRVQRSRFWRSTAVVVTYDDSDGWYDQAMSPIVNSSADPALDALNGPGVCGHGMPLGGYQDRCGYGPRLPLLVISPYSRVNYVNHSITDQTSVLRFIEDNWLHGEQLGAGSYDALASSIDPMFNFARRRLRPLILDPVTGAPARSRRHRRSR